MTHTNPLAPQRKNSDDRASRIAATILAASLIAMVFNAVLALQMKVWQVYGFVALVFLIAVLAFSGLRQIRSGRVESGMRQIIIGIMIVLPAGTLLVSGAGLIVGLIVVMTSYLYASQTLPAGEVRRVLIASLAVGALTAASDLLQLEFRLQIPAIQTFAPIISGLVFIFISSFIARDFWGRSMRNKLVASFLGVTLVAAGALSAYMIIATTRTLQESLELRLTEHTSEAANGIGALTDEQIDLVNTLALNETLQQVVQGLNQSYQADASAVQATMERRDAQWRAADAANNNSDPLVHNLLNNSAASALKAFQSEFPDHVEVFVTDKYGGQAGSTNRTSDYYQADEEWWQAAYDNGRGAVYVSQPEYDQSAQALAVLIALPLRNHETGEIIGILRTTYLADSFNDILGQAAGNTGVTALWVPGEDGSYFHASEFKQLDPQFLNVLQTIPDQGVAQVDIEGIPSILLQAPVQSLEEDSMVNSLGWKVVYHQERAEALTPVNSEIRGVVLVMAIVIILAVAAALALSLYLVRPIAQLTQTAEEVAAGNLNSRAKVTSTDEIGVLASTFNNMTSQLQETLHELEQRVAARTRDLAIVAEVGTATATILESRSLLQQVVDLTKDRFQLYHSHIYLLDEKGENLVLAAGAGEPGRVMVAEGRSIPLEREQSLVARAARERKGVTVNDVTQAPDFLANPLLPDTRSELAVPMIASGNLIGVFDIQSDEAGRFTDSDINIQTTLAAQLAVSIQNVRSFEQSRRQAELQSLVNMIGSRIQRTTSIEETLQTAIRELGTAIGASRVQATVSAAAPAKTTATD